ncbi:MAG TPA: type II toxin-antitoxin system VapC family toxin [Thermoanaerobaculia bacterium]|nr:type II toxin-antitoxin system VapC family toxin [Thermoanaerobaculia bacterium]
MNVVDSSGWLEYLADGPAADFFAPAIEDVENLLVPTITILEVGRIVHRQRGEEAALQAMALLEQATVVALDAALARSAVALGLTHRLPLADSIILATARAFDAGLWTQDADFKDLPAVHYSAKT